jgi:hypothetical protein
MAKLVAQDIKTTLIHMPHMLEKGEKKHEYEEKKWKTNIHIKILEMKKSIR